MKLDRRGFVLSAASLAAFPWVRRAAIPAASAADMSLLFHGDFNVENFEEYATYGTSSHMRLGVSGNSPTISTQQARTGAKSARIYLNRRTSGSKYRTEATAKGPKASLLFRRTYWIGFSIFVPSDWKVSSTGEALFQLHHRPPKWGEQHNFSPLLAIRVLGNSDKWFLATTTYKRRKTGSSSPTSSEPLP